MPQGDATRKISKEDEYLLAETYEAIVAELKEEAVKLEAAINRFNAKRDSLKFEQLAEKFEVSQSIVGDALTRQAVDVYFPLRSFKVNKLTGNRIGRPRKSEGDRGKNLYPYHDMLLTVNEVAEIIGWKTTAVNSKLCPSGGYTATDLIEGRKRDKARWSKEVLESE